MADEYAQNRGNIDAKDNTGSTNIIPSSGSLIAEYESNDNRIKTMSADAEIKHDTAQNVISKEAQNKDNIAIVKDKIEMGKAEVVKQKTALDNNHKNEIDNYSKKMETEKDNKTKAGLLYNEKAKIDSDFKEEDNGVMTRDEYNKYKNSD